LKASFLVLIPVILGILILRGGFTVDKSNTLYKMWYSAKPGHQGIPGGGIGYAISIDGIDWKRYERNPIIPHGAKGSFNEFESEQPTVVHDGKIFHMLYRGSSPLNVREQGGKKFGIGYAESTDGINWELYEKNPVTLDNGNIDNLGPIIYKDGCYKMWYSKSIHPEIYYATTKPNQSILELADYIKKPVLKKGALGEWDDQGILMCTILLEKGYYKMWYAGISGPPNVKYQIGYAISKDGIDWEKFTGNPVFDDETVFFEMNPMVVHDAAGYTMYYTAATQGSEYSPVRLATSPNGLTWTKYSNIPVLGGEKNNWEGMQLYVATVKFEED
jgi:hypothetical protein